MSSKKEPDETIGIKELKSLNDDELKRLFNRLSGEKARRATLVRELAPAGDKPKTELQLLVRDHHILTKQSVRLSNGVCDKKVLRGPDKGKVIPCPLPKDMIAEQQMLGEQFKKRAEKLEGLIKKQLEQTDVYRLFLRDVFCCGLITSAYLVSEIDIRRQGLKPSHVRVYCGYGVRVGADGNGHADRPRKDNQVWMPAVQARSRKPYPLKELDSRGDNGTTEVLVKLPLCYNATIKSVLWQMMQSMRKNAAKCTDDASYGVTNKYLDVWFNAKFAAVTVQRLPAGKADIKGMRKAVDLFLLDLYTIWRAIEGLDIWPSYYDSRRGGLHGGIPLHDQLPRRYTSDAALQFIGNFRTVPLQDKRCWTMAKGEGLPEVNDLAE